MTFLLDHSVQSHKLHNVPIYQKDMLHYTEMKKASDCSSGGLH